MFLPVLRVLTPDQFFSFESPRTGFKLTLSETVWSLNREESEFPDSDKSVVKGSQ